MQNRCALLGKTLSHSYSPQIHAHFAPYKYDLLSIPSEALQETLDDPRYMGFNVTIPYKVAVMEFLDEITPAAKRIGAVNTVVRENGKRIGDNTDYAGFLALARHAGVTFAKKRVLVLGSGGTSNTVRIAALDSGAQSVAIVSRTGPINYENLYQHPAQVLINATPMGMYPNNGGCLVDVGKMRGLESVLDAVYNPLRTALVLSAREHGLRAAGGLYMLVMQAALACERFTGQKVPEALVRDAYGDIHRTVENIILIGMPGSGKTSVAQKIAAETGREMLDLDAEIVRTAGMSIPEIFDKWGEAHFRALESAAVNDAAKRSGCVIACGGGVVKDIKNRAPLWQNGRVYQIERALDALSTEGRPLSKSAEALREMYLQRKDLYRAFSHATVKNEGTVLDCARAILEEFYEDSRFERPQP